MVNGNTYMTPEEAAEYLQVSDRTIRKWARGGQLKGRKLPGGQWRFTSADLDAAVVMVG